MTTIRYDLDARSTADAGLRVADVWRTLVAATEEWNGLLARFSVPVRFVAGPGMGSGAGCLVQFASEFVVKDLAGRPSAEGVHVIRHGFSKIYFSTGTRWRTVGSWAFWREPLVTGMLHELGHVLRVPHSTVKGFIMHPEWPSGARRIGVDEGLEYGIYLRGVVT